MAATVRRQSRPPPVFVNLYCSQCDNHLGIFENEWARLTSSYMRPTLPGQHFASEIAQKTQIVPNGVVGQAAEGCTMAEVFCKKCSVAVAQYCKAAPRPDQGKLVNQYFYKSSRTYLRTSDNKSRVDPIFGFSGDLKQISSRFSVPPRPKLFSVHRWPQTPSRSEYTPSRVQPSPQLHLQSRESSLFHTQTRAQPEESLALRLAAQEERLRRQEEKMAAQDQRNQEQEARVQAVYGKLDDFREILEDYKVKFEEIQAQAKIVTTSSQQLDQSLFVSNLEHLIAMSKNAGSISGEIERLRAENQALKIKLDAIKSPAGLTSAEMEGSHALGKRKRTSDVATAGHLQLQGITMGQANTGYHDQASLRRILTPQSSVASASGSQASEREDLDQRNRVDSCLQGVADADDHAREYEMFQAKDETSSTENDRAAPETSGTAPTIQTGNTESSSLVAYIDFSDDEHPSEPVVRTVQFNSIAGDTTQRSVPIETRGVDIRRKRALQNGQDNDTAGPKPEPETSSKRPRRNQRSIPRRVTDGEVNYEGRNDSRSLAPSIPPTPVVRRRTLPPKPGIDTPRGMEHVQIVTPTSHEKEMNTAKETRPEREIVQSTEKLLQLELIELGLEEWVGCKDKTTNSEYRKAVDAARNQRREQKKLEALASVGLNVSPTSPQRAEADGPVDSIPGAADNGTASSGETTGETAQSTAQDTSVEVSRPSIDNLEGDALAEKDEGVMTRRKQRRRDEIRRMDQLAREALEMDF
ncbi:uncharacterized protein A1O9_09487 [Exophiala aquamarina CBS 119918]|uniref:Yippee domain-containing protein n=1 Tax=Exophiala aquamarina CBS 119918 TaxID=1182545 RepID=A0A072P3C7_9EURO|nr:uncharacterized protein A1O9_09487 [Exophiala aquamarina CBS 119918]KEF54321.1 hypothetical protein A1O9_09487 [Exophiala aquamarina CBS 119918]